MHRVRRRRHRRRAEGRLIDGAAEDPPRYAVFVSPHGFGHAARASAVMAALHALEGARFEIFSTVPEWFFEESLAGLCRLHEVECDVGFRQASALHADLPATVEALERLLPFGEALIGTLAERALEAGCRAVLCDIAPMGVAVAERARLPSAIVENFDWSWLYAYYADDVRGLRPHMEALAEWRSRADLLVQTEPLCARLQGAPLVPPISRAPRTPREETRARLGVDRDNALVTVTMGGYREEMPFLDRLRDVPEFTFLVTGARRSAREGNLRLLTHRTPVFMPDLLRASDAVVAKLGYGIIAEVWAEGLPFAFVGRPDFPETPALEAFVRGNVPCVEVASPDFTAGEWIAGLPQLVGMRRRPHPDGGADAVARLVSRL